VESCTWALLMAEGDRVVWVGPEAERGVGSTGKIMEQRSRRVLVNWGGGQVSFHTYGHHVIRPATAARRGMEPWASVWRRTGRG
jgi:hypothetical protein